MTAHPQKIDDPTDSSRILPLHFGALRCSLDLRARLFRSPGDCQPSALRTLTLFQPGYTGGGTALRVASSK
jgi:hypothetical protein